MASNGPKIDWLLSSVVNGSCVSSPRFLSLPLSLSIYPRFACLSHSANVSRLEAFFSIRESKCKTVVCLLSLPQKLLLHLEGIREVSGFRIGDVFCYPEVYTGQESCSVPASKVRLHNLCPSKNRNSVELLLSEFGGFPVCSGFLPSFLPTHRIVLYSSHWVLLRLSDVLPISLVGRFVFVNFLRLFCWVCFFF